MKKAEYLSMYEKEKIYWWHIARMYTVKTLLEKYARNKNKNRILNVGCGTGGTVNTLQQYGEVTNIDISPEAIKFLKKNGYIGTLVKEGQPLPFKNNSFDIVFALDVLEHIDRDIDSLYEFKRVLKKNGLLILTVPAFKFLWSGHDDSLHHKRRYIKTTLNWDIQKVGLSINKLSYYFMFSFILVAGFRLFNKLLNIKIDEKSSYVTLPYLLNNFLINLGKVESHAIKMVDLPLGTSLVAICEKNE